MLELLNLHTVAFRQYQKKFFIFQFVFVVFQAVSGQFPPKKIVPRLWLGFRLGLGLMLGLVDNFPQ